MGLISKEVEINLTSNNIQYYETKRYEISKRKDKWGRVGVKRGTKIKVKIEDLQNGSSVKVDIQCDGCGEILKDIRWVDYKKQVKKDKTYYCFKCANAGFKKWKDFEQWCVENNRQDILDRWDYELNDCKPNEINAGTNKKYYFKCPKRIHKSELKIINGFTLREGNSMKCNACNSFEQWCIENDKQDVLDRWDYNLNKCNPLEVSYSTNKKYYFKCPRGLHKSELKDINSFIYDSGSLECKVCNSFAQWGISHIGEDFLEKYWDYEKNKDIDPWEVSWGWNKKVYIKCQEKDYHESYDVTCNNFTNKNSRCPYCNSNGGKVHKLDSLGTLHPKALKIWSNKNKKSALEYTPYSEQKVWWTCPDEIHNDYKRDIKSSNMLEFRCPECSRERSESFLQEKVRLYFTELRYTLLHEYNCTLKCINPKTNFPLPYDNQIVELDLICEVNGIQHYSLTNFHNLSAKKHNTTPEAELQYIKDKDTHKMNFALSNGYNYLVIPYWEDNKEETWKTLIDNKIKEIYIRQQNIS